MIICINDGIKFAPLFILKQKNVPKKYDIDKIIVYSY